MYDKDLEIEDNNPQWIKFVDYFNEFWKEKFNEVGHFQYQNRFDKVHIISKHMGFIEWLVKNNKVNLENLQCVFSGQINKWKTMLEEKDGFESYEGTEYEATESLIMLLAVQDDPITFILEILK